MNTLKLTLKDEHPEIPQTNRCKMLMNKDNSLQKGYQRVNTEE